MGIGVSIFLITLGAILKFAIKAHLSGVDLPTIGLILMIAGGATLVLTIVLMSRASREVPGNNNERLYDRDNNPPTV